LSRQHREPSPRVPALPFVEGTRVKQNRPRRISVFASPGTVLIHKRGKRIHSQGYSNHYDVDIFP